MKYELKAWSIVKINELKVARSDILVGIVRFKLEELTRLLLSHSRSTRLLFYVSVGTISFKQCVLVDIILI